MPRPKSPRLSGESYERLLTLLCQRMELPSDIRQLVRESPAAALAAEVNWEVRDGVRAIWNTLLVKAKAKDCFTLLADALPEHLAMREVAGDLRDLLAELVDDASSATHSASRNDPPVVGTTGIEQLAEALSALGLVRHVDQHNCRPEFLRQLADEVSIGYPGLARDRVLSIIRTLLLSIATVRYIRSGLEGLLEQGWLAEALRDFDRLVKVQSFLRDDLIGQFDFDHVEHVAFTRTAIDESLPAAKALACYVVCLFSRAGLDPLADSSSTAGIWRNELGQSGFLVEARRKLEALRQEHSLLLTVSLHESHTDDRWPAEIEAWLHLDRELIAHDCFTCTGADQLGAEAALVEAIDWAHREYRSSGSELKRIDVAVPAKLLPRWHPEQVVHQVELQVDYDVTMRWAGRLRRPVAGGDDLPRLGKRLRELRDNLLTGGPEWLDEERTRQPEALREQLVKGLGGIYAAALSVPPPDDGGDLLMLLFGFLPTVLWPHPGPSVTPDKQEAIGKFWSRLPQGVHDAARDRRVRGIHHPIVDFRVVWDDEEWLDFCGNIRLIKDRSKEQ